MFSISQDKDKILNDLPKFQKLLESIIENLLSKENEEENFLIFCENNILERIIEITNYKEKKINLIIIKVFSILIPNLKNKKLEYYLFSNNYMNQIICNISYNNKEDDIDYLSFYINFLKTLANKIDLDSFHLFFNRNYQRFPLLDELIIFLTYDKDIMIKNTSRNIFLTLLKLNYKPFIEYICDLPTITLFLLFSENLKNKFIYFCKAKENKQSTNTIIISNDNDKTKINSNINIYNEIEENKETLADDISFIQDILSIDVPKIHYLLINTIFYISLRYLFNNILLRQNADVSFYILNLFLEIIKNQSIKNIIIFILYYSVIQINIIEIVANDEILDVYRLLDLNKLVFREINVESDNNKLAFDDYIILNYSSRFLNSLRYIKDTDNIYNELKDISRQLNKSDDVSNEVKTSIKLLNKKIKRITFVLKQIEQYHNFISKVTGINVGVSINSASHSFLQIIHNNYKENLCLQENIFKNECIYYFTNFHLSQYLCVINEMFLMNQIIKDEDISKGLKFKLNLMADFSKLNDNKNENSEKLDEDNKINIDQNFDTPPPASFKFNSVNNYSKFYEDKNNIYKNLFGEKNNDIYLTSFLSLPNISNERTDLSSYDSNINLIVDNKIMSYKEMDLNNEFFDKVLAYHKSNAELLILDKLINLLLERKKTLNKISYKLIIDIINDLLLNGNNICQINEDIRKRINEQYKQLLQIINDLLDKSTLEEQIKDEEYFYEFFENCFHLNKKDISEIKKNYVNTTLLIINEENLKDYNNKIGLDLMKIPNEKYQMLKCLFQKFISLYDLKIIINADEQKGSNLILKYQNFPLNFFDVNEFTNEINEISLSEKLKVELFKLKYKTEKDLSFENGILTVYKNMLLLFKNKLPINKESNKNKISNDTNNNSSTNSYNNNNNEINNNIQENIDKNDIYIIDKIIPLRKIKINETVKKEFDKSKYLILNILYRDTQFQLILLLENEPNALLKIKDFIMSEIKKEIDAEYSTLKYYFKSLLDNDVLDANNIEK